MANQIKTKISLRKDTAANWALASATVLLDGEVAIVVAEDGSENLKIGNGLSSFAQLPFLYQNSFATKQVKTSELRAKSIAQGYNTKATPTSLATGIFTEADGNFDVVHGIEARALSTDDYAFVFNGTNLPGVNQRYVSHGEGTFNVNPLSGLSGFYIGEETLADAFGRYTPSAALSNYYTKAQVNSIAVQLDDKIISVDAKLSGYYRKTETSSATEISASLSEKIKIGYFNPLSGYDLSSSDLSVVKLSELDYLKLLADGNADEKTIYVTSSDVVMARDRRIVDVLDPVEPSDAATKGYLDTSLIGRLLSSDLSLTYDRGTNYIRLNAFGNGEIGSIDCTDFVKDGMLSSVQLCGDSLVFIFNTDAGKTPISVKLSAFVDDYSAQISALSSAISVIGSDYLTSEDKQDILNRTLQPEEVKLYRGPGLKDISLSVGTGTTLSVYTVGFEDFYLSDETSSAVQLSDEFARHTTTIKTWHKLSD